MRLDEDMEEAEELDNNLGNLGTLRLLLFEETLDALKKSSSERMVASAVLAVRLDEDLPVWSQRTTTG